MKEFTCRRVAFRNGNEILSLRRDGKYAGEWELSTLEKLFGRVDLTQFYVCSVNELKAPIPVLAHMRAISDIAAERHRQVIEEGYDASDDDAHTEGQLANAAAWYAAESNEPEIEDLWPFQAHLDKKADFSRRRQLVIAAALLIAEIERLDRNEAVTLTAPPPPLAQGWCVVGGEEHRVVPADGDANGDVFVIPAINRVNKFSRAALAATGIEIHWDQPASSPANSK